MNSLVMSVADIVTESPPEPPRIVLYGTHGIGKTSFAAQSYKPVFIEAETSLATLGLKVARFPQKPRRFSDVIESIEALLTEEHEYGTLVIDTIDALEPAVWDAVCADENKKDIESFGYGKGYVAAVGKWRVLLEGLDALRAKKNMAIILIAHAHIKRFDSPIVDPFDRYQLKLHEKSAAVICDWADHVLFANYRVVVTQSKKGDATRGVGSGERVLYTEERPAFWAKHRALEGHPWPSEIKFDWNTLASYINGESA